MARNTVQKKYTTTQVRGFVIRDGQPEEVTFELDRKCGIATAQAIVRKQEPTFAAVEVVESEQLYKMDFDTFKKYATPCEDGE